VAARGDEPLIYRTEVLAIIGALADLVVDVGDIRDALVEDDEGEGQKEPSKRQAERAATVQRLRELEARGWAELRNRRKRAAGQT